MTEQAAMRPLTQAKSNRRGTKGATDTHRRLVKDPVRYKTQMCQNWVRTGGCPYGFKCQFAHGQDDLRTRAEKKEGDSSDAKPRRASAGEAVCDVCDEGTLPLAPVSVSSPPPLAPTLPPTAPERGSPAPLLQLSPQLAAASAIARPELRLDWAPPSANTFAAPFALPPPVSAPTSPSARTSSASSLASACSPYRPPLAASLLPSHWPEQRLSLFSHGSGGSASLRDEADSERDSERRDSICSGDELGEIGEMLKCNSVTGAIEIALPPGVGRSASHNTVTVRRQISQLFDDELPPLAGPKTPKHKLWFGCDGVWTGGVGPTPQPISLF